MKALSGLRERKKLKAMRHVQDVALDLFDRHGYTAVTVERIAAEAEVSPSSIYRYFGTKEQIVLNDQYDPVAMQAIEEELELHDPVTALRRVIGQSMQLPLAADEEFVRRRMHYAMTEPSIRAAMSRQTEEFREFLAEALAKHTGRDAGSLDIRVASAALVAGFVEAVAYWHDSGYREPLGTLLDGTIEVFGRGFELDRDAAAPGVAPVGVTAPAGPARGKSIRRH